MIASIALALAAVPTTSTAQTPALAAQAQAPAPAMTPDQRTLAALNDAWLNSHVTRNGAALAEILADDFVAVYGNGRRRTKAETIASLSQGAQVLSVRAENLNIHVSGDTAVVTARSVLSLRDAQGRTVEVRNAYADIYVRRNGRWRAIAAHIVRAPAGS